MHATYHFSSAVLIPKVDVPQRPLPHTIASVYMIPTHGFPVNVYDTIPNVISRSAHRRHPILSNLPDFPGNCGRWSRRRREAWDAPRDPLLRAGQLLAHRLAHGRFLSSRASPGRGVPCFVTHLRTCCVFLRTNAERNPVEAIQVISGWKSMKPVSSLRSRISFCSTHQHIRRLV